MTESEFLTMAEATLDAVEAAVDASGADIEASRSGNVLTLELGDGSKVIVNSQAPMQQLWLAAKSGAFHYQRSGEKWLDTRDHTEFFATLSRVLSQQGDEAVILSPR